MTGNRRKPMPTTELRLPPDAAWLAGMLDETALGLLGRVDARMGGGTVLAARWNEHRVSRDLDIFIPAPAFDAAFGEINRMQARIGTRLQPERRPNFWTNPRAGVFVIHCPMADGREIEFIRTPRLGSRDTDIEPGETVHGTTGRIKTLRTATILAGKLATRAPALAERDVYDLAFAAERAPEALTSALGQTNEAMVHEFLRRLEGVDEAPRDDKRPVTEPTWDDWRTHAPEVLRSTLTTFLSTRTATRARSLEDPPGAAR